MRQFHRGGQKAGLPKSSVSQRISQLEQALGLRLINRTTRQLNLTFAGERYLVHCQEMMQASERANVAIERLRDNPSGRLRITSPAGIGATLLARLNAAFQQEYPDVTLEVSVSDEVRDIVLEGYDVALRTGQPQDSSLIGRQVVTASGCWWLLRATLNNMRRSRIRSSWLNTAALRTGHGANGC